MTKEMGTVMAMIHLVSYCEISPTLFLDFKHLQILAVCGFLDYNTVAKNKEVHWPMYTVYDDIMILASQD